MQRNQDDIELYNNFLNDYFYEDYKSDNPRNRIELIVSPKCNLGCKYCYIHKYKDKLYGESIYNDKSIIDNLYKVLDWYIDNNFKCSLEIFSGELLAQKIGYRILDILYERFSRSKYRPEVISIPTNFTFICSEYYKNIVEEYINKFKSIDIVLALSASIDGKYLEKNRPFTSNIDIDFNVVRSDEYYETVFDFISRYRCGIHPMIYSEGIELWIKNFDWFQEIMSRYNISWKSIYLLQVRNSNWSESQNYELYKFIRYLFKFASDKCHNNPELLTDFILKDKGFNILSSIFGSSSKGLSCSIQSNLPIRLSDMKVFPCHRLMYDELEIGRFDINNFEFITTNPELGLEVYSSDFKSYPMCYKCPINQLCLGGCLGSQYEVVGDIFTPIPTVCRNYYYIVKAIIDGAKECKVYDRLYSVLPINKKYQLDMFEELL